MQKLNKKLQQVIVKKYLPHNFIAEKVILSSLLTNPETVEIIFNHLTVESFYFKNHQELYKIMFFLYKKKIPIDTIILTNFLHDNGLLEKIGGIKLLQQLINQIPNRIYLQDYIKLLQDKFLRRALIQLGYQIINSSYITNIPLENILKDIEIRLFNIMNQRENVTLINSTELLINIFLDLKEKFLKQKLAGLESGFRNLDLITQGFQKSDLIIIAGRPSMGKTAFCVNIVTFILKTYQLPIVFFSLEMSKEQLMSRILSNETEISISNLRKGNINKEEWKKLTLAIKNLSLLPIFIEDTTNISNHSIRIKLKKILFEQTKIGLIVIDYLQLMQNDKLKPENRVQELSQITKNLKAIAREFNIPVIALSQLSRNVENRINKRPLLSDLRESGSIEQDADLVLMLYRQNYYDFKKNQQDLAEIIIAKHRNGPLGTINLKFDAKCTKFFN
jgi:replicative DNA helicase